MSSNAVVKVMKITQTVVEMAEGDSEIIQRVAMSLLQVCGITSGPKGPSKTPPSAKPPKGGSKKDSNNNNVAPPDSKPKSDPKVRLSVEESKLVRSWLREFLELEALPPGFPKLATKSARELKSKNNLKKDVLLAARDWKDLVRPFLAETTGSSGSTSEGVKTPPESATPSPKKTSDPPTLDKLGKDLIGTKATVFKRLKASRKEALAVASSRKKAFKSSKISGQDILGHEVAYYNAWLRLSKMSERVSLAFDTSKIEDPLRDLDLPLKLEQIQSMARDTLGNELVTEEHDALKGVKFLKNQDPKTGKSLLPK